MKLTNQIVQQLINYGVLIYDPSTDRCNLNPVAETLGWEVSLGFEDVAIKQKKNKCKSRLDVDVESEVIKGVFRPIPMIASNMSTVCNSDFCILLHKLGALGVMHRAAPEEILFDEVEKIAKEVPDVAASIGVGESQIELAKQLIIRGCNIIFIDIAHGYSDEVINTGRLVKDLYPDVKVVVGNTTNIGLMQESMEFADAIKVGIAQGAACETKNTAGCTEKQFSAVLKFKQISKELGIPVISDGGIKEGADMVKALGAGANSIMAGSIFARCPESAAPVVSHPTKGHPVKLYAGMACYSNDTEILTENGWKLFKDLNSNEKVATLNQDGYLHYSFPTNYFEYDYSGDMIKVEGTAVNLLVTPNHRMYVARRNSPKGISDFKFVEAKDCVGNNKRFIYKKTSKWLGENNELFTIPDVLIRKKSKLKKEYMHTCKGAETPMKEWLDFFGFWLAEGSATKYLAHAESSKFYNKNHFSYNISVSNNDLILIEHYKKLLSSWGFNPYIRSRGNNHELIINSLSLYTYLSQFGKAHEKFIPRSIKNLNSIYLKLLLKGIYLGDGVKGKNHIITSSIMLRNDIFEIAQKCEKTPTLSLNHKKGSKGSIGGKEFMRNHDTWAVYVGDYWKNPNMKPHHHSVEKYSGKVYCVEVPGSIVCVRRDFKYVWCGNSRFVQNQWKGGLKDGTCPEGGVRYLGMGELLEPFLKRWSGALKSGITYGGGVDIESFQREVEFVKLTS